jgi:hypothetical protein
MFSIFVHLLAWPCIRHDDDPMTQPLFSLPEEDQSAAAPAYYYFDY